MATPSVSLSAPYIVFPLSLPLHQTKPKGQEGSSSYRSCYTSPVESRKRKRTSGNNEIATAVDGEGVNIYDLRSTQTISSYALQPFTKFSCAPTSTVSKVSKTGTFRRTYAALSAPKKQLVCWEETSDGDERQETPVKQHTTDLASSHDVVYIQDLSVTAKRGKQRDEQADSGLLAVYADGHIRFFSEDLQKRHWNFTIPSQKTDTTTVVYAAIASSATARKSVFSNRPDIALPDNTGDVVLLVITKSATAYNAQFIAVPVIVGKRDPRELLSFQLPTRDETSVPTRSIFSVHFPTGTLYQLSATHLTTYNLTLTQPTIMTIIPIQSTEAPGAHPPSLLRISSSTVLVATNDEISLYDTKYSSLQSSISIQSSTQSSAALSRSSTPASSTSGLTGSVFLTTYIVDMDLVIGYAQGGIVGIQLTRSRADKKGGLLIDSIGRGVQGAAYVPPQKSNPPNPLFRQLENERAKTRNAITAMRNAKDAGDLFEFERVFAKYVGAKGLAEQAQINKVTNDSKEDTDMVNGSTSDKENSMVAATRKEVVDLGFEIPESFYKPLRLEFVTAVLSMIFAVTEPSSVNEEQQQVMTVSLFPPNVLRYLLESGNFSTSSLPLSEGLVKALLAYDPTLRALQWFLSTLTDFPVAEILVAIKLALSPLTAVPEDEDNVIFEIHRAEIVRIALIRLASFPDPTIIKSLKSLPSDTLTLLIRLLENELIATDDEFEEPGKTLGIEDIRVVADLLTAAIDAVGMSGLIMTETTDMLNGLMENVDEALEMVEQAADLKGLMEELFRHVDWRHVAEDAGQQTTTATTAVEEAPTQTSEEEVDVVVVEEQAPSTTTSQSLTLKKQPAILRSNSNKRRRDRHSAAAHKKSLARINAHRKAAVVVGHKKMLRQASVSKSELIKQDRPVALSAAKGISPILPLGALALRRLVDPRVGKEFRVDEAADKRGGTMKREYWREGLAAGAYSVESMVV
ncbi:hypothetical protein K440DRAFT_581770 [Wilcoxina mikolae CBS 423.85]|nr:hypothetical protein K440DRAFT_581770 [Wilcoxina mikolae CBS 423.85]